MQRMDASTTLRLTPSRKSNYQDLVDNAVKIADVHQTNRQGNYVVKLMPQNNLSTPAFIYPVIFSPQVSPEEISFPNTMRYHFGYRNNNTYEFTLLEQGRSLNKIATEITFKITRLVPFNPDRQIDLKETELIPLIRNRFREFPFCMHQHIYLPFDKTISIELVVTKISNDADCTELFDIDDATTIFLELKSYTSDIKLERTRPVNTSERVEMPLIVPEPDVQPNHSDTEPPVFNLNFKEKGIGGLQSVLAQIVREVLLSRALGEKYEAYGVPHTKGCILYGVPGTGKTLIARAIGTLYAAEHVTVINGPELKNPLVGQSAANLRAAFASAKDAWIRYGKKSHTEVVIIDEIDVVFPRRTMSATQESGSQVNNDMVAQILTILDGVDSPQNIIVIGATNRLNTLDPALLRPGRLEICIEIPLPNQEARYEILCIQTEKLRTNHLLAADVNIADWAARTDYFTGAELSQLVKKAVHYSIQSSFEIDKDNFTLRLKPDIQSTNNLPPVTAAYFELAFSEIKPVNVPVQPVTSSLVSVLRRSGSPVHASNPPDNGKDDCLPAYRGEQLR